MKITAITYKTNASLGNYRHEHVEMTAELTEQDSPETALALLKQRVHAALGIDVTEADVAHAKEVLKKAKRLEGKTDRFGRDIDD